MAREFARSFYKSKGWKTTREAYISAHPLCEKHLKRGEFVIGEIVHHKTHLSPDNIDDPSISMGFDNLETLCRDCHASEHPEVYGKDVETDPPRVGFDENGNLVNLEGLRKW